MVADALALKLARFGVRIIDGSHLDEPVLDVIAGCRRSVGPGKLGAVPIGVIAVLKQRLAIARHPDQLAGEIVGESIGAGHISGRFYLLRHPTELVAPVLDVDEIRRRESSDVSSELGKLIVSVTVRN